MTHPYYSASMNDANPQGFQTPYQATRSLPQPDYDERAQITVQEDAFAGQYPPPRPRRRSTQPTMYPPYNNNEYPTGTGGGGDGIFPVPHLNPGSSNRNDDQATVHTNNSGYTRSSGPSMANSQTHTRRNSTNDEHDTSGLISGTAGAAAIGAATGAGLMAASDHASPNEKGYYDPHAIPLNEWQQSERQTNLADNSYPGNDANMIEMADTSNRRGSQNLVPQPEPQYIEAGYPTVAPPSYLRPDRDGYLPGSRGRPQPKHKPQPMVPVVPPFTSPTPMPNQYYPPPPPPPPPRQPVQPYAMPPPQAYKPRREPSPVCCCYCPAMTCCSCFCMLISLGFVAAGIAMIVYAKVASQSCPACDHSSSLAGICDACNTVLYDGLFYGGIAVAALAGIGVVWRLFMWMCSARR